MNDTAVGYIYGLTSTETPSCIMYIGASVNPKQRLISHISEVKKYPHLRKSAWIREVRNRGFNVSIYPILCVPIDQIYEKEKETIKLFKSFGAPLVNDTVGGLGGALGQSINKKIAATLKRRYDKGEIQTWNKGVPMEEFQKIKVSQNRKGKGLRRIYSINKSTGEEILHESLQAASEFTGIHYCTISMQARHQFKRTIYSYRFRYYE